jgi:hypothetical protein
MGEIKRHLISGVDALVRIAESVSLYACADSLRIEDLQFGLWESGTLSRVRRDALHTVGKPSRLAPGRAS